MGVYAYGPQVGGAPAIGKRYGAYGYATEQATGDGDPNIYAGLIGRGDYGSLNEGRLVGTRSAGTAWAGHFLGNVYVQGHFTVTGFKSAAVPDPNGDLRPLYTVESPEPWFEDFGRADLRDGQARVELDADFAALVHTDDYHVFVTPEGDSNGLYVSARTDREFEVREQRDGTGSLGFSYRVLARRKDVTAERLQLVEPPVDRPVPELEPDEEEPAQEWEEAEPETSG
jgi:hypothetical protein